MSPAPKDAIASNQTLGLEIALDRPSRTYHPGDRVTGKLIINSNGISLVGKRTEISALIIAQFPSNFQQVGRLTQLHLLDRNMTELS